MSRKLCPLLVQSDTTPSLTMQGESWTRTYFAECIGEKCMAYRKQDGFCELWERVTRGEEAEKAGAPGGVIHCKDCKFLEFSDHHGECAKGCIGIVGPEDYCSRGFPEEKKAEAPHE